MLFTRTRGANRFDALPDNLPQSSGRLHRPPADVLTKFWADDLTRASIADICSRSILATHGICVSDDAGHAAPLRSETCEKFT